MGQDCITPTRQEDYPRMVPTSDSRRRFGGNFAGARLHGDQTVGLGDLGTCASRVLDGMFKATVHENAYFPLFIP